MDTFARAFEYATAHGDELAGAFGRHLLLVSVALAAGIALCAPLGALTARSRVASVTFVNGFNAVRVVPSLAILFLAIPYFGLSLTSALVALAVLACPPILLNSDAAFRAIDPAVREAALGVGMTARQALVRVEVPIALPKILAGIRIAAVEVISSATLAAFVGGGGLGVFVVRGFSLYDTSILLVGAIPVAALALAAEAALGTLERALGRGMS
jgi:osmoprotectant transport system permease protein